MKLKQWVVLMGVILLLTGCNKSEVSNEREKTKKWEGDTVSNVESSMIDSNKEESKQASITEPLDFFYGVYGVPEVEEIEVIPSDEDGFFHVYYTNQLMGQNLIVRYVRIAYQDEKSVKGSRDSLEKSKLEIDNPEKVSLIVVGDEKEITLEFNAKIFPNAKEEGNTVITLEKVPVKAITQAERESYLQEVITKQFQEINQDVFEVVSDTPNYLILKIKAYILDNDYYYLEGSESTQIAKYYHFDKNKKELLTLDSLLNHSEDNKKALNQYLKEAIEEKKQSWVLGTDPQWQEKEGVVNPHDEKMWPYEEFQEIQTNGNYENYFFIDEEKQVVKIRCLPFPDYSQRKLGDICIDVPFSMFEGL